MNAYVRRLYWKWGTGRIMLGIWQDESFTHYAAVVVLAVFAGVQLFAFARLWRIVSRQSKLLAQIGLRTDLFTTPASAIERRKFWWLAWVRDRVGAPNGAAAAEEGASGSRFSVGKYTRDDFLNELDWYTHRDYAWLRRTPFMAPLMGLAVTILGFFHLALAREFPAERVDLHVIMTTMIPLLDGVAIGALLALLGQLLTYTADRLSNRLQQQAVAWFDAQVWDRVEDDTRLVAESAVQEYRRLSESIRASVRDAIAESASRRGKPFGVERLESAIESQVECWTQIGKSLAILAPIMQEKLAVSVLSLSDELHETRAQLSRAADGFEAAAQRTAGLADKTDQALGSICGTLGGVELAVKERLLPVAESCHSATKALEESSVLLRGSTTALDTHVGEFGKVLVTEFEVVSNQLQAAKSFREGVEQGLADAHARFADSARNVQTATGQLSEQVSSLGATMGKGLEQAYRLIDSLGVTAYGLGGGAEKLKQSVDVLMGAAENFRGASETILASTATVGGSAVVLAGASQEFAQAVASHVTIVESFSRNVVPAQESLAAAAAGFSTSCDAISRLAPTVETGVQELLLRADQTAHSASAMVVSLQENVTRFGVAVGELQPATTRFGELAVQFQAASTEVHAATTSLDNSCQGLAVAAGNQVEAVRSMNEFISRDVPAMTKEVQDALAGFSELTRQLSRQVIDFQQSVGAVTGELGGMVHNVAGTASTLDSAARAFLNSVDSFGANSETYRQGMETIAEAAPSFAAFADRLDSGYSALRNIVADQNNVRVNYVSTFQLLESSLDGLRAAGLGMSKSLDSVSPTLQSLNSAALGLDSAVEGLTAASRLDQLNDRLQALDATLLKLQRTVDSLEQINSLQGDFTELADNLAHMSRAAHAIAGLPDRLEGALGHFAARQPAPPIAERAAANGSGRKRLLRRLVDAWYGEAS